MTYNAQAIRHEVFPTNYYGFDSNIADFYMKRKECKTGLQLCLDYVQISLFLVVIIFDSVTVLLPGGR